jgi:hypothetical protein
MSSKAPFSSRAIGLLVLACAAAAGAEDAPRPADRKPPRVYTNADLDRVHPFAGQTGGSSTPAPAPDEPRAAEPERGPRGRGERYWRDEAARVRERVRSFEERAAALRARIAERSRETPVYGRGGGSASKSGGVASLQASLAALERRIRSTQNDLEERARRDGALPGWLR